MIGTKGNKMFLLVLVISNILCTDLLEDVKRKNKAGPLWGRFLDSKLLSLLSLTLVFQLPWLLKACHATPEEKINITASPLQSGASIASISSIAHSCTERKQGTC